MSTIFRAIICAMREKKKPNQPVFVLVTSLTDPEQMKPDLGCYSPKELAAKENTTTTSVYNWLNEGLPHLRRGAKGNIYIYYQDYIQWMIECAKADKPRVEIPSWAFRFIRDTSPKVIHRDPQNPEQISFL